MDQSKKISMPLEKQNYPLEDSLLHPPKNRTKSTLTSSGLTIFNFIEEDVFVMLLDRMTDAIVLIKDETIVYANFAWESLTGYTLNDVLGLSFAALRSSAEHLVWQNIYAYIQQGKTWRGEIVAQRADGSEYESALTVTPIYDDHGELTYFSAVSRDLTEEKRRLHAQEAFLTDVSHGIRTPLTNIKLYLSLLEKGASDNRERYLETLNRESRRLQKVTEDMLLLSQFDMDRIEPTVETFSVGKLVAEVVASHSKPANMQEVTVHYRSDRELLNNVEAPSIKSDRALLAELLGQLLTNAIAYTDVDGEVEMTTGLCTKAGQKWCTISVRDSGFGIELSEHKRLFERFYRGRASHEMNISGTGLGLSICQEIARYLGGKIELESALGEGSTFTLFLPVVHLASPKPLRNAAQHRHLQTI